MIQLKENYVTMTCIISETINSILSNTLKSLTHPQSLMAQAHPQTGDRTIHSSAMSNNHQIYLAASYL
jgi:hypothetical protein